MHSLMNLILDMQKYDSLADWHLESQKPSSLAREMAYGIKPLSIKPTPKSILRFAHTCLGMCTTYPENIDKCNKTIC